jgi:hypothetical protein
MVFFLLAFPPISYMHSSSHSFVLRAHLFLDLIVPEDGTTSLFSPVPCLKGLCDDYSFLFRRTFKACCLGRGCLHSSQFFRCCNHLFIAVIGVTASRLIMHNVGGFTSLSCASHAISDEYCQASVKQPQASLCMKKFVFACATHRATDPRI